jgi:hypothetical protein
MRSRRPAPFRQQDVTRALRAAKAAGMEVLQIEFDKERGFRLLFGGTRAEAAKPGSAETAEVNPLDKWMATHAGKTKGH